MAEILVRPDEVSISIGERVNLLDVALAAGVDIAHLCGGRARCSTCRVRVIEGASNLTERTEDEAVMASKLDLPDEIRLACQTEVSGSALLWRLVLDRADVEMASQLEGHNSGPVGREVKAAAVLFADVAGFTAMSESLPPYDVLHILNRFFRRAALAIEGLDGRVDNYMGDGLLAVFGVNGESDPAVCAVRSGLKIIDVAADMDRYVSLIYGHAFRVRVGIGLGDVIFGMMGGESSARETVIGDVVNTASRLEAANKVTGSTMLVTEAVYAATDGQIEYGRRFDLELPGKDGHVTAHEPIGLSDESDAPATHE